MGVIQSDDERLVMTENTNPEITPEMIAASINAMFKWSGEFNFDRFTNAELAPFAELILSSALKAKSRGDGLND